MSAQFLENYNRNEIGGPAMRRGTPNNQNQTQRNPQLHRLRAHNSIHISKPLGFRPAGRVDSPQEPGVHGFT